MRVKFSLRIFFLNFLNFPFLKKQFKNYPRLILLIATGFPGFYKLIFIYTCKRYGGYEFLGGISDEISYGYILSCFTAIGATSYILGNIKSRESHFEIVHTIFYCIVGLIFCFPVYFLLYFEKMISHLFSSYLFLVAWSFYQLFRSIFIAMKKNLVGFLIDSICLSLSIIFIIFKWFSTISYSLPLLVGSAVAFMVLLRMNVFRFKNINKRNFNRISMHSIKYSVGNGFQTTMERGVVPLIYALSTTYYVGLYSYLESLFATSLLMPRYLFLKYVPLLGEKSTAEIKKMLWKKVLVLNVFFVIFSFSLMIYFKASHSMFELYLFLVVVLIYFTKINSTILGSVLVSKNKSSYLVIQNIFSFSIYSTMIILIYTFQKNSNTNVALILITYLFTLIFQFISYFKKMSHL